MTMKRISVFVSDRQYEQFRTLSEKMGQPYAELIRQALNNYLQQHAIDATPKRTARKRVRARRRA